MAQKANYHQLEAAEQLIPLLKAIARRLDGMTILRASEMTGMPNWKIGRILSRSIVAPAYLDMTRLIVFAGITPNHAASMVGLYNEDEYALGEDAKTAHLVMNLIQKLQRSGLNVETQERLMKQFEMLVEAERLMQEEHDPQKASQMA